MLEQCIYIFLTVEINYWNIFVYVNQTCKIVIKNYKVYKIFSLTLLPCLTIMSKTDCILFIH